MRIQEVPKSVQFGSHRYPPHVRQPGLEEAFGEYAAANADTLDTDWIYIPIYWTNNYVAKGFHGQSAAQAVLDSLNERERYFTVVQCDDGIYEDVPSNVLVFGAGGTGDIPVPLICEHHAKRTRPKDTVASFMGTIECGGPSPCEGHPKQSTWEVDGDGASVRRDMAKVFGRCRHCEIQPRQDTNAFVELMARSEFALAPRGYGRTSFRLYEAMGLGCVPIYFYSDTEWLPYKDRLVWHEFAIVQSIKNVCSVHELAHARLGSEWHAKALRLIDQLVPEYFTVHATCRQIFRMIRERT